MKLIRILLFPFSILYGCFIVIRNTMFDFDLLKKNSTNVFSIGVGNLSLGGTGKSILVDYLISENEKSNNISVISRGYGRKSSGLKIASPKSTANDIGDEPYQYLNKYPKIKVIVAEKRIEAIKKISKLYPEVDLLIFDDIMQHRSILTNHLVITTSYDKPFFRDYLFPVGNLREFRAEKKRANTILVTKCPKNLSLEDRIKFTDNLNLSPKQKVYFSTITYPKILINSIKKINFVEIKKNKMTLVTGIADPSNLLSHLDSKKIIYDHLKYKDHFNFDEKAISKIKKVSKNSLILTTEKDFARLSPLLKTDKLFYIPIQLTFFSNKEEIDFNKRIKLN